MAAKLVSIDCIKNESRFKQTNKRKINFHLLFLILLLNACGGSDKNTDNVAPSIPNIAPVASAGDDQSFSEDNEVILSGSGSDADGTIVSYQWQQVEGTSVTIEDKDKQTAYFIAPNTSLTIRLTFQLTVTDDHAASHSDTTIITVDQNASAVWEPSSVSNCDINQNVSPVAASAASVLTSVGLRMFEPSIIFSDQTFTWFSREEVGPSSKHIDILSADLYQSLDGEDSSLAYDDGTHGDQAAGDGIFTRSCLYVPETFLDDNDFREFSNLWVIRSSFRNTESTVYLSPNVRANDTGFFISLGTQYAARSDNTWFLHSPETCEACTIAWQLAGDVFDFFSVTPRDPLGGGGYLRVHDNIKGTGFNPPCELNSYCYNIIDGAEHQKLSGIIWNGWPGMDALNHELGHGLLGLETRDFPAEGEGAWNSGDLMHHDADITVNGDLSGPFWDPARGWPYSVQLENMAGERFETYLIKDSDGQFKLQPMDENFWVWDDILLYMMGLLTETEVTKTYYKLLNPILSDCTSGEQHLICTNDLVTAEQVIPFTVADFAAKFGSWSAPEFYQPANLTMGVLNISDRPHTNAEIVWMSRVHREFAATTPASQTWFKGTTWAQATRGLSKIHIDAISFAEQNK
jgi:hypothetical protein